MKRVEELTIKLLDGVISEPEATELESLVADDSQARALHLSLCDLEAGLRATGQTIDVRQESMERIRGYGGSVSNSQSKSTWVDDSEIPVLEQGADSFSFSRFVAQFARGEGRWSQRLPLAAALAASVLLLVTATVFLLNRTSDAPGEDVAAVTIDATIAHTEEGVIVVRAGQELAASKDFHLRPKDLLIVPSGAVAAIRFSDQSRLLLGSDSRATLQPNSDRETLTSEKTLLLEHGRLTAHVTKQAAGHSLKIRTNNAQVTVLGTRFTLAADKDSTRLDVVQGRVAMTRSDDQESVEVSQGMFAVASPGVELAARPVPPRVSDSLTVLYRFQESGGGVVHDVSGAGQPLDLQIDEPNAVRWLSDGGLLLEKPALLASKQPAKKVIEACKKSHAITIETWVRPANSTQRGPARLVTLSKNTSDRNFTLGQGGAKSEPLSSRFDARLRTSKTSSNGLPSVVTPSGSVEADLTHVVYTRTPHGQVCIYVDGLLHASGQVAGNLSNWDEGYRLALGNELTGDRPWQGTYYLVAVYGRALTQDEVLRNFQVALH